MEDLQHTLLGEASAARPEVAPTTVGVEPASADGPHQDLSSLDDGERVDSFYVVRDRNKRPTKRGGQWLALKLSDRSGSQSAKCWDEVDACFEAAEPGTVVRLRGRFESSAQWGAALIVERIRPACEGEYDPVDLLETSPVPLERMVTDLRSLVETIQTPALRALLDRFLGDGTPRWERFRDAPAAKHYHQAYRHGLMEHALSVAQSVSAAASFFPGINRDVAVTGALLHDIGKCEAYNDDPLAIDLTDRGRLQGEIPLGYYRVRREIEEIEGFDPDLGQEILHIILSHHGTLEHGSPVVPATREATLVHMMDNLGGRLGSFDRIERGLADGEAWSRFDRGIDAAAYFGARAA
ncbi:MAG: 3'-5' exoribonuclease YhaM family protein [Solirubrobacterales bacterium]